MNCIDPGAALFLDLSRAALQKLINISIVINKCIAAQQITITMRLICSLTKLITCSYNCLRPISSLTKNPADIAWGMMMRMITE